MDGDLNRTDSNLSINQTRPWIEKSGFQKRECCRFIPTTKDHALCGCGKTVARHHGAALPFTSLAPSANSLSDPTLVSTAGASASESTLNPLNRFTVRATPGFTQSAGNTTTQEKWIPAQHTEASLTDAYGTIEFQGGPHPTKAQYVRLAYDTSPELILQLLTKHWNLELPKLLISVHGGIANFDLQPKLEAVFTKGLLKAAKTTGAWIVSAGINTGVVRHVGNSLGDTLIQARNHIVSLGCAPWGVVHNRHDLIGRDCVTKYHAACSAPKNNNVVLNSNHAYFLLVDNGTVGKYGGEIQVRKRLEKLIQQQKIQTRSGNRSYNTPVLCLVLEGGTNTIRTVLECITDSPPVPVVVCDGSGRAADLLAFTHKYAQDDGTMPERLRDQLIQTIEKTFQYSSEQAEKLFIELMLCVKKKELITVFRMGEEAQDIDMAILTALLKAQNASLAHQLSLALAWNRPDIAKSYIFVYGQEWPENTLDLAMMDALMNDRVDFVKLLIENGVSMNKWLTIPRIEELYNVKDSGSSTLRFLIANKKRLSGSSRFSLLDIGTVIEKLMGGAYRASFCRKRFRTLYHSIMKKGHHISNIISELTLPVSVNETPTLQVFKYPYHELMVWAVLMKRHRMAKFMWQNGEEALAKALVACKLYKSMAHEAAQDDLEEEISVELKKYAREFGKMAVDLLEQCYETDDDVTQHLLTYELSEWSDQTCLSLAVAGNHRDLIAHTCCQMLLTEMWMGAMRTRKYTSLKVIMGIVFFPSILFLEFKSKEEMQLQPQTLEEHIQEQEDTDSSDSESTDSSASNPRTAPSRIKEKTETTATMSDNFMLASAVHATKKSPLRVGKKIYEFYTAPVTKFWFHTLGYIAFLVMITYTVLVKMERFPNWLEWYTIAFIFTLFIEAWREVIVSEPTKFGQKLYVYFTEIWKICDTVAIALTTIGVILRFVPSTHGHGKVCYAVAIVFWYVRLLDIFSVSKYLGPYVTMIGKMMKDLVNFIVILLVVLMSFGIVRQGVTYPNEEWSWHLVKHVFLKPYFMIYGEVYAGEIDPECSDDDPDNEFKCVPGRWIVPAVMSIFLIVANILLINLLIAVFNNTFYQMNVISNKIWKFQRYSLVIEYECKPILPPPFILICHLYLVIRYFIRKCRGKHHPFDNGLKLFLERDEVEQVHDFEEEAMADLSRKKDTTFRSCTDERIRTTNERVENMSLRLDDLNQKENNMRLSLQTVDYRLAKVENLVLQSLSGLDKLQHSLSSIQLASEMSMLRQQEFQEMLLAQQRLLLPSATQPLFLTTTHSSVVTAVTQTSAQTLANSTAKNLATSSTSLDCKYSTAGELRTSTAGLLLCTCTDHGVVEPNDLRLTASHSPASQKARSVFANSAISKGARVNFAPTQHRKKGKSKERLRPFTDYSKRHRPPLHRAVTLGTPEPLSMELENIYANYLSSGVPPASSVSEEAKAKIVQPRLYERRKKRKRGPAKMAGNRAALGNTRGVAGSSGAHIYSPVDERQENGELSPLILPEKTNTRVTFSDGMNGGLVCDKEQLNMDRRKLSLPLAGTKLFANYMRPDRSTNFSNSLVDEEPYLPVAPSQDSLSSQLSLPFPPRLAPNGEAMQTDTRIPTAQTLRRRLKDSLQLRQQSLQTSSVFVPEMPSSRAYALQQEARYAALPIGPIITPTRVEYTTITDDIDTSCINYKSPHGSPTTPHTFSERGVDFFTKKEQPAMYRRRHHSARSHDAPDSAAAQQLKSAEEAEHKQMELVLRRRMRQISLTERDSMGDIATLFINEIDQSSTSESSEEPLYFSDDDVRSLVPPNEERPPSRGMRHVKSEPLIKIPSPTAEIEQCHSLEDGSSRANSQSPALVTAGVKSQSVSTFDNTGVSSESGGGTAMDEERFLVQNILFADC